MPSAHAKPAARQVARGIGTCSVVAAAPTFTRIRTCVCVCVIVLSPLPPYSVRPLSALHPSVPVSAAKLLCKRADATGTNPTTEVDTRESLGCP